MNNELNFAKQAVIEFFVERNTKAGRQLHENFFSFQADPRSNPKQKDALEHAVTELVKEGILEFTGSCFLLTKKGEDEIY